MKRWYEPYLNIAGSSTVAELAGIIMRSDEGISRAELARLTGFSKSTISQHVDTLIAAGLVMEGQDSPKIERRKAKYLKINKDAGFVIAVDLGATSLDIGVCDMDGELLAIDCSERIDLQDRETILKEIVIKARKLQKQTGIENDKLLGVGMGVPAPVEFISGKPISPPLMYPWDGFPIKEYLHQAFHVPAYVDNDVNVMAIAEHWKGSAKGDDNFLFIKLGTGIGCGIYCDGVIYRGTNGAAGDIGHVKVDGATVTCYCGHVGCLEKLAGGAAVTVAAQEMASSGKSPFLAEKLKSGETITASTLGQAINARDMTCIEYVRTLGNYIGEVVAKLVNFYNPTKLIFGGGLSNYGDILISPIQRVIFGSSSALTIRNLEICRTQLGEYIGVKGAALLVREELFGLTEFPRLLDFCLAKNNAAKK